MAVFIQLDKPHAHFTNLDFITGKVILRLDVNESISSIVVKLEGESKTRLGNDYVPGGYGRHDQRVELEVHKVSEIPMHVHDNTLKDELSIETSQGSAVWRCLK